MDPSIAEVLEAERKRASAFMTGNVQSLSQLLDERVAYVHSTGIRHSKAELLEFLAEGPTFLSVAVESPEVQCHRDEAVLTGRLRMKLLRRGETAEVEVSSWIVELWQRADENEPPWCLRYFQSTRAAQ